MDLSDAAGLIVLAGRLNVGFGTTMIPMDPQAAKQRGRIDYSLGRYSFWSAVFEPTSDRLIDTAGVSSGMRVLDVAAGDGNTALAAARRGATVIAVDITPAQVRRGRIRTEAEGAMVQWAEADEDRLPLRDVSFEVERGEALAIAKA